MPENEEIKNIVLVGRTGQGKSALANVLSEGDKNRIIKILEKGKKIENNELVKSEEGKLKESEGSKSETRSIQTIEFKYEGGKYRGKYKIIDSIGIGDTTLTQSEVLHEIAQGYEIIKGGVHQVLFVNGERFTPEEIETYNLLKGFFFNDDVDKYTTIVRTRFPSFEEEEECEKDIQLLLAENNPAITNMINSCERRIVHIDNPSVDIKGSGTRVGRQIALNKEVREASREKLLGCLEKWEGGNDCKPKNLKEIDKDFKSSVKEENKRLKKEISGIEDKLKKEESLVQEKKQELEEQKKKLEDQIKNNEKLEALVESNRLCQIL